LKTNGSRSRAALLLSKSKRTAIFTSRFKMRPGDKQGIVVVEIPAKPLWCSIRETVFSWTATRFPFHTSSSKKLALDQTPVITVTGKAYFDVGHSLKYQKSNRRSHLPGYAAWEIHPVMKLEVQ
jgi:hypothetical protein